MPKTGFSIFLTCWGENKADPKKKKRGGGTRPIPVDVRVIAATNANLEEKVKAGTFREDLSYRLNVIPIYILPFSWWNISSLNSIRNSAVR